MTDFLSRLVGRSVATIPVSHPVVPPLFAPGPMLAGAAALGEPEQAEPLRPPSPSASSPAGRRPEGRPALHPRDGGAAPSGPVAERAPLPSRPPAPVREPDPGTSTPDQDRRTMPSSSPKVVPSEVRVARPLPTPATPGPDRADARAAMAPPLRPRQEDAPEPGEVRRRRTPAALSVPPVVRISIGRIEVRAVAAPRSTTTVATSPPPQPTTPSLQEYLSQRSHRG